MKRTFAGIVLVGFIFVCSIGFRYGDGPKAEKTDETLVGSWERDSDHFPEHFVQIKHITPTHFTWVIYDSKEMVPYASAGGTWKLEGQKYTEKVEFATPSHEHLRGKEVVLDVVVKRDKFHQHGVLDTGFVIDEDWIRKK